MALFSTTLKQIDDTRALAKQQGKQFGTQITVESIVQDIQNLTKKILPNTAYLTDEQFENLQKEVHRLYIFVEKQTNNVKKDGLPLERQKLLEYSLNAARTMRDDMLAVNGDKNKLSHIYRQKRETPQPNEQQ